jgi:hypothetical protein
MKYRRQNGTFAYKKFIKDRFKTSIACECIACLSSVRVFRITPVPDYSRSIVDYIVPRICIVTSDMGGHKYDVGREKRPNVVYVRARPDPACHPYSVPVDRKPTREFITV